MFKLKESFTKLWEEEVKEEVAILFCPREPFSAWKKEEEEENRETKEKEEKEVTFPGSRRERERRESIRRIGEKQEEK